METLMKRNETRNDIQFQRITVLIEHTFNDIENAIENIQSPKVINVKNNENNLSHTKQ
jgi:hypothetical protein